MCSAPIRVGRIHVVIMVYMSDGDGGRVYILYTYRYHPLSRNPTGLMPSALSTYIYIQRRHLYNIPGIYRVIKPFRPYARDVESSTTTYYYLNVRKYTVFSLLIYMY